MLSGEEREFRAIAGIVCVVYTFSMHAPLPSFLGGFLAAKLSFNCTYSQILDNRVFASKEFGISIMRGGCVCKY
jgi:hypothetical protein